MTDEAKSSIWSWSMTDADLKNQVENYDALKITQSYRGLCVLIVSGLLALSLGLSFMGLFATPRDVLFGLILYVPILFFVYLGYRWAIIALMLLWTLEKALQIWMSGYQFWLSPLIWWLILMPYFWKALKVENLHKKKPPPQAAP